jgi:3D-(3,5/4)-trihydroxycyclohexane-1,2-dione acylhydrolase (decyclizing)
MKTRRLTTAQAIIEFLRQQYAERDGNRQAFFGGCFGIFGHGNVAGIGQALHQRQDFPYYLCRNEQAMVHTAAAFAKMSNRLRTLACTSSIGPGATNMITGAAAATINRVPVLLLPGDIFARRKVAPVLQQLESPGSQDISVNDCFKPVSRYWDRIYRPEQILTALPEAMRVLTSPADTGAVTLALPQDTQTEAFDYPEALFEKRIWHIARPRGDASAVRLAANWIRSSRRPIIVAGGGVIYSDAAVTLAAFAESTGIPVGETQAGKGSLPFDHPSCLGAIGVTGTPGANITAREADLVIGIGTRYSDFTTASKTAFQNPQVRFININVGEFDAAKHSGLAIVADARVALEELSDALSGWQVDAEYRARARTFNAEWDAEVERLYSPRHGPPLSQAEVLGAVNRVAAPTDVVVNAAGSMPGDLHKLWRSRDPKSYHMEYGYSTMGYEIAGGLGIRMAAPDREVWVMVGDGSYLMLAQEIATAVELGVKLNIVIVDNQGFSSINGLSHAAGVHGYGTLYRQAVDFAANARSLGAEVICAPTYADLVQALQQARSAKTATAVVVRTDLTDRVPGYESWWDVPIAEVSEVEEVRAARAKYEDARKRERYFL